MNRCTVLSYLGFGLLVFQPHWMFSRELKTMVTKNTLKDRHQSMVWAEEKWQNTLKEGGSGEEFEHYKYSILLARNKARKKWYTAHQIVRSMEQKKRTLADLDCQRKKAHEEWQALPDGSEKDNAFTQRTEAIKKWYAMHQKIRAIECRTRVVEKLEDEFLKATKEWLNTPKGFLEELAWKKAGEASLVLRRAKKLKNYWEYEDSNKDSKILKSIIAHEEIHRKNQEPMKK